MLERSTPDLALSASTDKRIVGRRVLFAALALATIAGLLALAGAALSAGGFGVADLVLLVLFGLTMPWSVIGFWNATIGFFIMRFARDPVAVCMPVVARVRDDEPIRVSTAILMCVRNEPPDRVIRNLDAMMRDLVAAGAAERFHLYVLSDTGIAEIAALEEKSFGALAAQWHGRVPVTYRRRMVNTGFKAGNIRDFCERWGSRHELAVTLDTDSFMTAAAILRLVRIMQADHKLGILQGLVVGMPSISAFARIFQFGMRLGMRSWTIGGAWWQGDCGPYWGHNAVIRIAPFTAHCHIPMLPGGGVLGGHVLSHDQIEAALMRRAGYEVRVLPEEELGWEENPPTLIEFIRRDQRWCQGTLQYGHFVFKPGLQPVSRFQLAFAMLMFVSSPAWIGLLVVGTLALALSPTPADFIRPDAGLALLVIILVMWFAPKIATVLDVLTRAELRRAFGGTARFLASVVSETVFFILLSPIMWCCHTLFLAGLPFGRAIGWIGQVRDDHTVPASVAFKQLWPHTALGIASLAVLAATHPVAIPYALLIAGGPALSVPLAVITAWPTVGAALARIGIGRLPEETAPPAALSGLALPAVTAAAPRTVSTLLQALRTARGVMRSLGIYYGPRKRKAAMDELYGRFVKPGDLAFDIGAHVGDRIAVFRRLNARVLAVEPQPALAFTLNLLYGRDRNVVIAPVAVGRVAGRLELMVNVDNPTVSTTSNAFVLAARDAPGWQGQAWERSIRVPATTLDTLIADHGVPAFIKIDIEGFEAEALAGLTQPVKALSFEFTTIQRDVARACIDRCAALGYTRFNAAIGESQELGAWRPAAEIARWLDTLPHDANSGDIYAQMA